MSLILPTDFPTDADHGPHGRHRIDVESCYMGPLSHAAFEAEGVARIVRAEIGTEFCSHPEFGNAIVQGNARIAIANLLDTNVDNVALTGNTHESLLKVRNGLGLTKNHNVLLYEAEYIDVRTAFVRRSDLSGGCNPVYIKGEKDSHGRYLGFDLQEFETAIKNQARPISLVVVSHVQFTSGFTTDLKALSDICKTHSIPLMVDAAQSFGALDIKPDELGLSALISPLWKWIGGYRGNAFLWTSAEFRQQLSLDRISSSGMDISGQGWLPDVTTSPLHADSRRFEPSTLPTEGLHPTAVMLGEAAAQTAIKIENRIRIAQALAREFLDGDSRLEIYKTPTGQDSLGSFLSVYLRDPYAGREADVFENLRINNKAHPIGMTHRAGFIRLGLHKFNSPNAIKRVCEELRRAAAQL